MEPITSFRGEYGFLSNFYDALVMYECSMYPSAENAYQAAKTLNILDRENFKTISASQAKALGKKIDLRPNWNSVKDRVMFDVVYNKFSRAPFRQKLIATGDAELIEGNTWHDTYWGMCNGVGENKLGKILMNVRARVIEEDEKNRAYSRDEKNWLQ